jgi:alkanesulfonate monooxygenase SsuD/methylene tetrahydromethanopterin reductase-like flavin-dependent oxidoreductase (luciferase family)
MTIDAGGSRSAIGVGVAIDFAPGSGATFGARLDHVLPVVEAAEALGYGTLSAGESYVDAVGDRMGFHAPNALMMLAAVAARTNSIRLVTGAALLSAWNTRRLAYDACLLDQISDGRVILGLGLGRPEQWERFGAPVADLSEHVDTMIVELRRLFGEVVPGPVQAGGPPIWIGGSAPRSARRAATLGDGYTASTGYSFDTVATMARRYRSALGEQTGGRPTVSVNRLAVIAATDSEASRRAAAGAEPLARAYIAAGTTRSIDRTASFDEIHPQLGLVGTPDQVRATVRRYVEAGVTDFQLRVVPGATEVRHAIESLELFAAEVWPAFGATDTGPRGRS